MQTRRSRNGTRACPKSRESPLRGASGATLPWCGEQSNGTSPRATPHCEVHGPGAAAENPHAHERQRRRCTSALAVASPGTAACAAAVVHFADVVAEESSARKRTATQSVLQAPAMTWTKRLNGIDCLPVIESDDVDANLLHSLISGRCSVSAGGGVKALMVAVLEDGLRCYMSPVMWHRTQAELWMFSQRSASPFAFETLCEALGLDADAVRASMRNLAGSRTLAADSRSRSRPNVRRTTELGRPIRRRRHPAGRGPQAPS